MNYHFILLYFSLLFSFVTESVNDPQTGIRVSIQNLRSNKGHILISLFRNGNGYPDEPEKAIRKQRLSIADKSATVIFPGLPSGQYAIAILHDENDDEKMNKNFFGIPKEGYGFSNNVTGTFGPPSFSKASFAYTTNTGVYLRIKARY